MEPKQRIFYWIAKRVGLHAEASSSDRWEQILAERMKASKIGNLDIYHSLLSTSPEEFQELIERLVVPETWFLRDRIVFDLLVHYYQKEWRAAHPYKRMELLSLPCSSGEEPYSIVMAFFEAHIPREKFRIEGVDISRKALTLAQEGIYSQNSFRGGGEELKERYFDPTKFGFQIKKEVREQVHFSYGNVCDPDFAKSGRLYDVILMRNLLIYLDDEAKERALQACAQLLEPDGWLIVSPAESASVRRHGFISKEMGRVFVRQRPGLEKVKPEGPRLAPSIKQDEKKPEVETGVFERAQTLADKGSFAEAEALCRIYLRDNIMEPKAHFLLGAIRHAQGDMQGAEEAFNKVVYLQPRHEEALIYLALLAEKRGDQGQADQFRRRIKHE